MREWRAWRRAGLGDLRGAIADYDRAISLEPSRASAWRERGVTKLRAGLDGVEDLSAAIEIDPADALAYAHRAIASRSLADAERACDLAPKVAFYRFVRAGLRELDGDAKGAQDDFRDAVALDPDDPRFREPFDRLGAWEGPRGL